MKKTRHLTLRPIRRVRHLPWIWTCNPPSSTARRAIFQPTRCITTVLLMTK